MKVLVTGSYGQLGSELNELARIHKNWQFIFTDADSLDITDEKAILFFLSKYLPNIVINCAAYTAVDKAETDAETAQKLNTVAPGIMASAAKEAGAGFIHISTDYVFDGKCFRPYTENDTPNPQTVYGKTKLEGELNCLAGNPESVIIRTSWLYSSFGTNFVKTMLRLGQEQESLNIVFDQVGTPTYAADLAKAILYIAEKRYAYPESFVPGIYHYSNEGVASWYDFAFSVFEHSGITCKIHPLLSKDFPRPARRPFYSVLDKSKIKNTYNIKIPYWKDSLQICLKKLNIEESR